MSYYVYVPAFTEQGEPLKYCDCADCGEVVLGESCAEWYESIPDGKKLEVPTPVAGRVMGRPYCKACIHTAKMKRRSA